MWWPEGGGGFMIVFSTRFLLLREDRSLQEDRFLPIWLCRIIDPTSVLSQLMREVHTLSSLFGNAVILG